MTAVRRALRLVVQGAGVLLVSLVLAELGLQVAALFARNRGTGWRPGAAHRILCIGDSHTFGALVPAEESYPGHLQRLLDDHAPGAYSVVNLGIPGMNTAQVRDRLRVALASERPDMVIVWCGVNDAWNRTESSGAPAESPWLVRALMRVRLYRLVQTWRNDRRLDQVLAQIVPGQQQRYEVMDYTDPANAERRRLAVVGGDHTEQLVFEDTGLRVEPEMEERAARDYRQMIEDSRAAGVPIAFVTYPVDTDAFDLANRAIRRVAGEYGAPVVESSRSVQRVPPAQRNLLWAGHPTGPMYAEIARDVVHVVLGGLLAEMTFEGAGLREASSVTGACARTTTDCAAGTGCYRWNPSETTCNVRKRFPAEQHPVRVRASLRFRVTAFPAGIGGYDVFGLSEDVYGTGVCAQFTKRDQLMLFTMGSQGAQATCGPLASHVVPGTWYGLRVRAEKSNRANATLELLAAGGEVIDSVTCADLPAGGGTFTSLTVGSSTPFGATADITFDDVAVYEELG